MGTRVYLAIDPNGVRLVGAGCGGAVDERIELDSEQWASCWSEGLKPLDHRVRSVVDRAKLAGARATIVYTSPSAIADLHSSPGAGRAACDAALLALRDTAPFDLADESYSITLLARGGSGEARRSHMLLAADRAASLSIVYAFAQRIGLKVDRTIPTQVLSLASVAQRAMASRDKSVRAILHLDDQSAALAASAGGEIVFVRLIDLGLNRIIEAMTRSVRRSDGGDGDEFAYSFSAAKGLFEEHGVPSFDQVVDPARSITGADLLPLIQPVLQRLVVEVKQSLRFGLSDEQRREATLRIVGRGARIPRLGEVIAKEADVGLADGDEPGGAVCAFDEFTGPGSRLADALEEINLMPPDAAAERFVGMVRRGVLVGAGLGAAVMLLDAGMTHHQLRALDGQFASVDDDAREAEKRIGAMEEAQARLHGARRALAAINDESPLSVTWGAWLATLAHATKEDMILTDISGSFELGAPVAQVQGVSFADDDATAREAITSCVAELGACALVESIELGGIRRVAVDGRGGHGFSITARLIGAPMPLALKEGIR